MVDLACSQLPPPNTRVHAEVSMRAGGSAVNAATAAAAAGASAAVVGRIGSDRGGGLVAAQLEELGTDPSSPSVVANRGANARLSPQDVPEVIEATPSSSPASRSSGRDRPKRRGRRSSVSRAPGQASTSPALATEAAGIDLSHAGSRRTLVLAAAEEARAMTEEEPADALFDATIFIRPPRLHSRAAGARGRARGSPTSTARRRQAVARSPAALAAAVASGAVRVPVPHRR